LDGTDIALLSIAASAWTGAALEKESTSALIKLASMGLDSDSEALSLLAPRVSGTDQNFAVLTDAIIRRSEIEFTYVGSDLSRSARRVAPYSMRGRAGSWYLVGLDLEKGSLRTFRLDRIFSEISVGKKNNAYVIPENIPEQHPEEVQEVALLRVRKNRGHQLRSLATLLHSGDDWDDVSIPILSASWLLRLILWHRDDVIVVKPATLRKDVLASLIDLQVLHG
jgi:proteasome accessory factor B